MTWVGSLRLARLVIGSVRSMGSRKITLGKPHLNLDALSSTDTTADHYVLPPYS